MIIREYPVLVKRLQALIIDMLLLLVCLIFISQLVRLLNGVPSVVRATTFIIVFVLYDPFMTSKYGGTFGHKAVGIRIGKANAEKENINFLAAMIRFIVKSLLGWISLLTVTANSRKRAIHDLAGGSVVTFKKKFLADAAILSAGSIENIPPDILPVREEIRE
ncbi:RDD family protein [Nafulsella turpanensis]|uniref:RDD family protein n=1 Tax=Nafulsella turpanensis TaxID=1265690 RepID=UPI000361D442|nr:RDD family protein [Nafulsella turpanensis]